MHPRDQQISEITYSKDMAKCPSNLLCNWLIVAALKRVEIRTVARVVD